MFGVGCTYGGDGNRFPTGKTSIQKTSSAIIKKTSAHVTF
jgi:hypothetical protein